MKNEVDRASGQAARPPERELEGPPVAVQDTRQKPLALTQSIDFFRAGSKDYINKSITARSIVLARIDLFAFNSLAFMGARTEARQGKSDFLDARPRMRDIFAAELRLTWQFFSLERDHARALNELAGLETFVPFLVLLLFSHVCVPS